MKNIFYFTRNFFSIHIHIQYLHKKKHPSSSMDTTKYLESYGWVQGQPLQKGGLAKPILVSHKFDLKGIGHESKDTTTWWETVFDGQLKTLNVDSQGISIDVEKQKTLEREEMKKKSPLYQMFVKGETLMGTVDKAGNRLVEHVRGTKRERDLVEVESEQLVFFDSSDDESDKEDRKRRKEEKKEKKKRKMAKKENKMAKKEKKGKKKGKKDKKNKKDKKH